MKKESSEEPSSHRINESSAIRRYCLFPKSLASSVEQLVKPVYKKHGFAEHRILTQWPSIVGQQLAAYSLPQKLMLRGGKNEAGTLYILVASGRALELQHMQPIILDKIATYFGYKAVGRLSFIQTSTPLFRKQMTVTMKTRPPLSASLSALVNECEVPELREALVSLGRAIVAVEN